MTTPTFPLAPGSVQDGALTLDLFVQEPTRVSRYVADVVAANLISPYLFSTTGAAGGAILFDQITELEAGTDTDPGIIAPGGEFPRIGSELGEPIIRTVQKSGGEWEITREALLRNKPDVLQRHAQRVANKMVRDIDGRAFKTITDDLQETDGALSLTSAGWGTAQTVAEGTKTAKTGSNQVVAELLQAKLLSEETELGYNLDTLIMTPAEHTAMQILLGVDGWAQILTDLGLTAFKTTALPAGTALLLQRQMAGTMGVEDPISTDTEYVKARQVQMFYTWSSMAFGVTDPFSVVTITGLDK